MFYLLKIALGRNLALEFSEQMQASHNILRCVNYPLMGDHMHLHIPKSLKARVSVLTTSIEIPLMFLKIFVTLVIRKRKGAG